MTSVSARCATMFVIAAVLLGKAAAQQPRPTVPPGSASQRIEAPSIRLTRDEALPPVGKGNLISDAQVRYCQAQLIRIDAIRPLLNRYEREEVEHFNALVADFNNRCGNYRYKGNALAEAKTWLEDSREQIDAKRDAYMKRFPAEPKIAKSEKKAAEKRHQAAHRHPDTGTWH